MQNDCNTCELSYIMEKQKELAPLVDSHQIGESVSYTKLGPKISTFVQYPISAVV